MTPTEITSVAEALDTWQRVLRWVYYTSISITNKKHHVTAVRIAENERLRQAWDTLFPAIEHGDAEHRAWLKDKLETWLRTALADAQTPDK